MEAIEEISKGDFCKWCGEFCDNPESVWDDDNRASVVLCDNCGGIVRSMKP